MRTGVAPSTATSLSAASTRRTLRLLSGRRTVGESLVGVNDSVSLRLCEAVDGLRPTFEDAFRADYPGIVRVISPIVGSVADAEAVAQDAFVKAFTRWRRIGQYDRPGAWIRRVAIRDAVRFAERGRRAPSNPPHCSDPDDAVVARIDLARALTRLSPKQRACVVLHHLADWPTSDVADALGCNEATVRVHLHRARGALALLLESDHEELPDGR